MSRRDKSPNFRGRVGDKREFYVGTINQSSGLKYDSNNISILTCMRYNIQGPSLKVTKRQMEKRKILMLHEACHDGEILSSSIKNYIYRSSHLHRIGPYITPL